jgi:hypothetical protein
VQLHIVTEFTHSAELYLIIVVTLLLFLSESLIEWQREIFSRLDTGAASAHKIHTDAELWQRDILSRLDRQADYLRAVRESMRTENVLLTLEKSTEDFVQRVKRIEAGQKLVIEHFGLDVTFAWERVARLMTHMPNVTDLEYRLLIMSYEDDEQLACFDGEVKEWISGGRKQRAIILEELKDIKLQWTGRIFTSEVRTYAAIPLVHGIRVLEPFQAAYISICRWGGNSFNNYRWGGDSYHLITETSLSDAQRDLLEIFDGNFQHFWRMGTIPRQGQ